MKPTDLADCTATDLLAMYRSKQASPVEATRAVLARIERLNPRLLAFCHLAGSEALESARASEARWQRGEPAGALDGVPTSIKDLILTKGWPTLRGSRAVDAAQAWDVDAPASAVCAKRALCCSARPARRSSVARARPTRRAPASRATRGTRARLQAVRRAAPRRQWPRAWVRCRWARTVPAACAFRRRFCGNFGLKPSFGRVPAYPLSPFGTVAHLGPHTMSVRDAALMLNVLAQPDARDWTSLPYDARDYTVGLEDGLRGLRIAWSPTLGYAKNVHPEVAAACARAIDDLRGTGARIDAVDPGFDDPLEITCGLWFLGAWTVWNTLTPQQQELTDPDFAAESELGSRISALEAQRLTCAAARWRAHAPVHATLRPARHPTVAVPAFEARPRGTRRSTPPRCSAGRRFPIRST
jgi:aspartyl-tRNA(Asn)/glutamyl-tRNA(Gln) amidotransferase subunit A